MTDGTLGKILNEAMASSKMRYEMKMMELAIENKKKVIENQKKVIEEYERGYANQKITISLAIDLFEKLKQEIEAKK